MTLVKCFHVIKWTSTSIWLFIKVSDWFWYWSTSSCIVKNYFNDCRSPVTLQMCLIFINSLERFFHCLDFPSSYWIGCTLTFFSISVSIRAGTNTTKWYFLQKLFLISPSYRRVHKQAYNPIQNRFTVIQYVEIAMWVILGQMFSQQVLSCSSQWVTVILILIQPIWSWTSS